MGRHPRRRATWRRRPGTPVLMVLAALTASLTACGGPSSSSPASAVTVGATSRGWVFHDGQPVAVSMGPNHLFTPYSHVNIIQCADPGGSRANLPTKFVECDENTIQGDTVVVKADGSFDEKAFTVFSLPSQALGESPDGSPVCNQTHQCVLLISEYQTDLSKPKAFSHSFTVVPSGGPGGSP